MTLLSPSVLPLIPSAFATGDRITYGQHTVERLASGMWESPALGPAPFPVTDAQIRTLFVSPFALDTLGGVPLFAPANAPADMPLPGRPVADGESPYEVGRSYLICSTGNEVPTMLDAVPVDEGGPWGTAQAALTAEGGRTGGAEFEVSMTETGTVYLRIPGGAVTLAYVPAEDPTQDEANALIEHAALQCAYALAAEFGVL